MLLRRVKTTRDLLEILTWEALGLGLFGNGILTQVSDYTDFHYFPRLSSPSERHPPVHTARLRYLDENGPRPRPTFLG